MLSSQLETLEKNTNRVCSKLKSMSSLQFGDKWCTTSQSPQKNTILTAIMRTIWYWGEGVEVSVADFHATLEEAFTLIYECIDKYPHYVRDEQNTITRLIVKLTDNVSNVKMAVVRQKGAYANNPNKESARTSLDELITYVDDTLNEVSESIQGAGIHQKIEKDFRARKHKVHNPVIVPTKSIPVNITVETVQTSSASYEQTPPPTVVAPPPPTVSEEQSEDYGDDLEF